MSTTVSNIRWASLVNGKKETEDEYQVRRVLAEKKDRAEAAVKQAAIDKLAEESALNSALTKGTPPRALIAPGDKPFMYLPNGVNRRAADLAEQFIWSNYRKCACGTCRETWVLPEGTIAEMCPRCGTPGIYPILSATTTVAEFRTHFDIYYTAQVLNRFQGKYIGGYNTWRQTSGSLPINLDSITAWTDYMKASQETPWFNTMYVYTSNTRMDSVLWALSLSGTFRTPFQVLSKRDEDGHFLSGFLKVANKNELGDAAGLTWLVDDITAYRSYPRRAREREE